LALDPGPARTGDVVTGPHPALATARERVATTLKELIEPGTRCALVDFPWHADVGDSAIWLGERALLREAGVDPVYACDLRSFCVEQLSARLPTGTILLHGGGNLGDLWPHHQALRERVIAAFPRHRIIQLPQSVQFREPMNARRARAVFDAHPDLTLLLRDHRSLDRARAMFGARSLLCPDSALAMPGLPAFTRPLRRILWLGRTDHEAAGVAAPEPTTGVHRTDWTAGQGAGAGWHRSRRVAEREIRLAVAGVRQGGTDRAFAALFRAYDRYARLQVRRGCRLVGSARVVVTDRLHAHLLCLLTGRPHVVLDDRHGKVRDYRETWGHAGRASTVVHAPTPDRALWEAERLADGRRTPVEDLPLPEETNG
jgi:pyruvyl transferase EpsO